MRRHENFAKIHQHALKGYECKRLYGSNRYATCLKILNEAGVDNGSDVIVCSGNGYADALTASASGKPILLVADTLTDAQKDFLASKSGLKFTILGGPTVVNKTVESALRSYGSVSRTC